MKRVDSGPVISKLLEGKTPKEIAFELSCTSAAIHQRITRFRKSMGGKTLVHAVALYLKRGQNQ